MSAPHDFSRRFFADFIASRIHARHPGEAGTLPDAPANLAQTDEAPARLDAEPAVASSLDAPRGLVRGLGSPGA